jgi:hypothetical protein
MRKPILLIESKLDDFKTKDNKEILLSVGNENKSYKDIKEAKKDLKVKTVNEAYTLLLNSYNNAIDRINTINRKNYELSKAKYDNKRKNNRNKIIQDVIKQNQEYYEKKQKSNRNKIIQNINRQIKEPYEFHKSIDVNIIVNISIYWKREQITYTETLDWQQTFNCKPSRLENVVDKYVNSFYPFEDEYKIIELINFKFQPIEKRPQVHLMDVPMKRASVCSLSFLTYVDNINEISYKNHDGKCVPEILKCHLGIKKDKTLIDVFEEASKKLYRNYNWKTEDGVTTRMLIYLCKKMNIPCLGLDQNTQKFAKYVRDENKAKKYKSVIFYMAMGHFYLINDEKAVRHISQSFKDNNMITSSIIESDEKRKENVYILAEELFHQLWDGSDEERNYEKEFELLNKLESNSIVLYRFSSLNNELKEYVKIYNDLPKMKF